MYLKYPPEGSCRGHGCTRILLDQADPEYCIRLSSQEIGRRHERRVRQLLEAWNVTHYAKKKFKTTQGVDIELVLWLPPTERRPAVVIECKTFGVAAVSLADSRRRKAQEALWLLVQVRRHCPETRDARIVVVTGERKFLPEQVDLLTAEMGQDFRVASVDALDDLRECLGLASEDRP